MPFVECSEVDNISFMHMYNEQNMYYTNFFLDTPYSLYVPRQEAQKRLEHSCTTLQQRT